MDKLAATTTLGEIVSLTLENLSKQQNHKLENLRSSFLVPDGAEGTWKMLNAPMFNWASILSNFYGPSLHRFPNTELIEKFIKEVNFFNDKQELALVHMHKVEQIIANILNSKNKEILTNQTTINFQDSIQHQIEKLILPTKKIQVYLFLGGVSFENDFIIDSHRFFSPDWKTKQAFFTVAQRNNHFASIGDFKYAGESILNCNSILEFNFELPWDANSIPGKENNSYIENIIRGLRFSHNHPVTVAARMSGEENHFYNPYFHSKELIRFFKKGCPPNSPHLLEILDLFIKNSANVKKLDFAIEKLTEISTLPRGNSFQVFDYISICEAIVIGNNEGEFSYKVPLHMTNLTFGLGTLTPNERFKLFRKCYELRSKVAHCSPVKPKHQVTGDELEHLRLTVQQLCLKALRSGLETLREEALSLALKQQ